MTQIAGELSVTALQLHAHLSSESTQVPQIHFNLAFFFLTLVQIAS